MIRQLTGRNHIFALVAAALIADRRLEQAREAIQNEAEWQTQPLHRTVHIIVSLKRPEEVDTLRRIYGSGFFLIGVSASKEERERYLAQRGIGQEDATALIETDANQSVGYASRHARHFTSPMSLPRSGRKPACCVKRFAF